MTWPMVALGDFMPTRIPNVDPAKFETEIFELWSIPAFDAGAPEIVIGAEIGSSKKCVEPDDVLLSRIVPHIRRSWVVGPENANRKIASGEWITFRSEHFHPDYLRHVLVSDDFHSKFMRTVAGVGGSLLRARPDGVKEIEIPLPPLAEQKRIAGILDQADALRRLRHRAVERLNTLGQAIFHEMFGENIKGTTTTLEEFADIQIGHPFKSKNYVDAGQGTKLCRGANILPNQIDWKQQADWPLDLTEDYSDFALKLDDTVIAMDRPWISSGFKAALIGKADLPSLLVQRVARIRAEKTNTKNFIYHLIKSRKAQAYFRPTETTVPHISPIEVKSFPLIEPSTAELDAFEKAIARQASATNIAECGVISSETLFASLQQRAFRGEL